MLLEQTKAWEEEQRKQKHLDEARRSDKDKLDPVRESQAANGAGEASSRPGSGKGSRSLHSNTVFIICRRWLVAVLPPPRPDPSISAHSDNRGTCFGRPSEQVTTLHERR